MTDTSFAPAHLIASIMWLVHSNRHFATSSLTGSIIKKIHAAKISLP